MNESRKTRVRAEVIEAMQGWIAKKNFAPRTPLGWADYKLGIGEVMKFRGILAILEEKNSPFDLSLSF
ncbi:MAG: hypothetical protein ACTHMT_07780 [Verrucomicrobiota bacterium]